MRKCQVNIFAKCTDKIKRSRNEEEKKERANFFLAHCDWFIYHGLDLPPCEWHFGIVLMMPQSLLLPHCPRSLNPWVTASSSAALAAMRSVWPEDCSRRSSKALHLIWLGQLVHVQRHLSIWPSLSFAFASLHKTTNNLYSHQTFWPQRWFILINYNLLDRASPDCFSLAARVMSENIYTQRYIYFVHQLHRLRLQPTKI